jgi:hypothetical protein
MMSKNEGAALFLNNLKFGAIDSRYFTPKYL